MAKQIQVSTIAKPRDEYTSKFQLNTEVKQEWIPKKPSVIKKLKFENDVSLNTDEYCPVYKSYTSNDTFIAGKKGCVVFVLCVGGSGYGTDTKSWGGYYGAGWSDPVGGWQIDDNVDYKTQLYDKVLKRRDYKHNPPIDSTATPSSFGKYLSANAGLNIAENTITQYQNYRTWNIRGWASIWDWGSGQYRHRSETQNVRLSSGSYDGDLRGSSGEVKFGIFTLKPNEVVSISVGEGFVKGHVDVVYFELRNGNDEAIEKPSNPNDVTNKIPLPNPKPPVTPTPPTTIPLSLALNPSSVELEIGSTENIEIITNATSWTYSIDEAIASFDEASKEISAIAKGDTMLTIEGVRDSETIRRAVAVKVIEKQQIIDPTPPVTPTPPTQKTPIVINPEPLYPNLQNMNAEQLAYMYAVAYAFSKRFSAVQNDNNINVAVVPISEQVKQEIQSVYDNSLGVAKDALLQAGTSGYTSLANYISYYPFMQNQDDTHLQLLETLIREESGSLSDGTQYDHVFTDDVKNMDNEAFLNNLTTTWIKELDGLINRHKGNNPNMPQLPKQINYFALYPNLQNMNEEQLAYMYVMGLAWSKVFSMQQNGNSMTLIATPASEQVKQDLQNIYNQALTTAKATLITYAASGYNVLANYISYYPYMQNKDEAHLQLLETLIKAENGTTSDGQTYDHVFTDEVKNMSGEEFTDKLASVWVKELDGIITRSKQSNQATTLDSLNVVFSKTPNSYIQRSESADELQVNSFTQSWNDPSETDYISELFWYITYSQAGVNFTMEKVKETWLAQKNHAGDNNVSNTPEKRQTFINVGLQTSGDKVGAIGQIFKQAYETDMKDELFEAYDVAPYKMRLKESIYQLSNSELIELFTRACQKVYAITK